MLASAAAAGRLGMQSCPGGHLDPAVLLILDGQGLLRRRPAGRVGTDEAGAMPAPTAQLTGSPGRRTGVEDPIAADAHQHRSGQTGEYLISRPGEGASGVGRKRGLC